MPSDSKLKEVLHNLKFMSLSRTHFSDKQGMLALAGGVDALLLAAGNTSSPPGCSGNLLGE
jgi:hypothetical protein